MSVLIDTSIWIDHLSRGEPGLVRLLTLGRVATHPFVVGELACGNLRNRDEIIGLLSGLPFVTKADDDEVLRFMAAHQLHGKGLGWVDVHLLASCRLHRCALWTRDKRLLAAAEVLGVAAPVE